MTVTDHGTLGACRIVYDLAKTKKLKPILGLEAYFRDDNCPIFTAAGIPKDHPFKHNSKNKDTTKPPDFSGFVKYAHLTMHALDQEAYETMIKLLSKARLETHGSEQKPLFNWNDLEELGSKNITFGSGCLVGMVQRFLVDHNNAQLATQYYEKLRSIVKPGNFFVELFPHDCSKNWVSGTFITLANGDSLTKLKFHDGKWLRTNVGEIQASTLAQQFVKKDNKHQELLSVKDYQTWNDREPLRIVSVEKISDFILNECRVWCPDSDLQKGANRLMMILAKTHSDPILVSDDSHFALPEQKIVQNVRLLQGGKDSWRMYSSYHRKDNQEAFSHFEKTLGINLKTFEEWVDNSYAWASRFDNFKLEYKPSLPTKFYPQDTLKHTMELIKKHGRMDWNNKQYVDRLKAEITLLHKNGALDLLPYFFIDEEVCNLYERNGFLTGPGRGSAAGLLTSYLLGITHIDPLEFDLSLDRFITLDRINSGKLPDIDQDLSHRDLLVDPEDPYKGWLYEKFGDHVMQISVDTTSKIRNSVKDVMRMVRGSVPPEVESLTHKFQNAPQGVEEHNFVFGYDDGNGWVPGSIETDDNLRLFIKNYPEEWEIVKLTLGLVKNKGRHACGFVLANQPISSFIPTQFVSGILVTQYPAPSVEAVGGVKMDFLVISSLKDIGNAIELIQKRSRLDIPESTVLNGKKVPKIRIVPHNGQLLDIWKLWVSPSAPEVFLDVAEGKTETCFQYNTPGATQWLRQFNHEKSPGVKAIDSIDAMSVFTALDRPGPLNAMVSDPTSITSDIDETTGQSIVTYPNKHNTLVEYAHRARGELPSPDILPIFNTLFPETYGVMVYQEQLQKLYQTVTGCTGAQAEEFRGNMAKKKKEKIEKAYPIFMAAATIKLGSKENAQQVWDFIKEWASYGFNKSHATCYAVIGFACAYLKHHFPLEWWTSVLRNAEKNEINEKFWRYCGHLIDLPDVKLSGPVFEIQNERIRAPLSLLHGIGEGAHHQLQLYSPYTDIEDFCNKIQLHKEKGATVTYEKKIKEEKVKQVGADGKPLRDDNGKIVYNRNKIELDVEKKKMGSSALNRRVINTLIVSGAMDSLFPKEKEGRKLGVIDQLEMFEEALAKATGKKQEPINEKFLHINQIQRYQMRKHILPAYSVPILPMLVERQTPDIAEDEKGHWCYRGGSTDWLPFVSIEKYDELSALVPWPDNLTITVAAAVYIEGQRKFNYQGTKEAVEFIFDWDGTHHKMVKWQGRGQSLATRFKKPLKGSVCVILMTKYCENKDFCIEDVCEIQSPISEDD